MSELTPLNTDINREIDGDPFAADVSTAIYII